MMLPRRYREAIALDPKAATPHNGLGNLLLNQGRPDDAVGEYRQAIGLNPKSATPHNGLGNALARQNKLDAALEEYRQAVALDPKSATPHNGLGNALVRQDKLDAAREEFLQAVALDPKFANPHNGLGNVLLRQNKLDDAVSEYRQALALNPELALSRANLGGLYLQQAKLDQADAELHQAIALDPKLALAHFYLGQILYVQHQVEEALAEIRLSSELDPKSAEFRGNLATALRDAADVKMPSSNTVGRSRWTPARRSITRCSVRCCPRSPRTMRQKTEFRQALERDANLPVNLDELATGLIERASQSAAPGFANAILIDACWLLVTADHLSPGHADRSTAMRRIDERFAGQRRCPEPTADLRIDERPRG